VTLRSKNVIKKYFQDSDPGSTKNSEPKNLRMQNVYTRTGGQEVFCEENRNDGFGMLFSARKIYTKNRDHYLTILTLLLLLLQTNILSAQTCTCTGTNLVLNHSFESGTNNWTWSGGNLYSDTYAAQCGTKAGHFQITNTGSNWVSQQIGTVGTNGITAGSILNLSVYGGTHNPSFYHQVGISYFTSNWTYISGNYTEVNAQLPSMSLYNITSTVPANAHFITVEKGGNGDWIKTDRWCVSLSQCNPDNGSAPPFCAPQPICPTGNNFLWSQSINSSDGSPSNVRLICSSKLTHTIPGPYPAAFNGPVNVNVSDVVSYDGYAGRNNVTQQNERWRVVFRKNGSTVYESPYTNDVPDLRTQGYWRGALGTTVYLPNGADQIIIEHWAVANNSNCSNGPNSVVPVSVCVGFTPVTCSNVTNGGQIGSNQTSCLATYDPAPITNTTLPTGGTGNLEYMWLKSTTTCIAPNGSNDSEWEQISGANASSFDPGPLYQNTCYLRCSRRAGCTNWDGESNVVSVTVSGPAVQIASPITLVKDRVITNEVHCGNSNQRVLWMDCLIANGPGGNTETAKYWKIISGGSFKEYCDGTAYFEMRVQNLVTSTYQLDVKVVLSGRTHSAPAGSPHIEGCTSSAQSDWYYYTNMTGTISGVNGLAGALLSIDRKGGSFQVGTNASLYANAGQFGASGWLIYNVINQPSTFKLKAECGADFNFLLSGGALSQAQSFACGTICRGESVQLTANGAGGRPGYTYTWDNGLGSGQTKTVSPQTTTTYKVIITDTNGCSSSSQTTITVNPQPVLNAGQDVEICIGQSVLLTVNATNGTTPYTYTWPNPPGGTGNSKSVSPTTTTTYVVTVTDAKGCTATDDVRITVNPNPSVTANANSICSGNTLLVTSTPTGGTSPYQYSWTGPNGFTATSQNISRPNATSSMAGTYSVTVTDSKGCVATASTNATVTPGPTVNLGPDKSICNGDEYVINSEVTNVPTCGTQGTSRCDNPIVNSNGYISNQSTAAVCGDNAGAKLWTLGGNGTSYLTLDMGVSRPTGTQICVRVKLEHCSSSNSTNSDMKIRQSGSPDSGFTDLVASRTFSHSSYQTYCYTLATPARFIRVQDNGKCSFRLDYLEFTTPNTFNNSINYVWSGQGIIGSTTGSSVTVNQNGTYVLVVTDCNGCTASDQININIHNNVLASVNNAEICLGQSTTLTANFIAGATYEWAEQGSSTVISTAQSITVSPTSNKVYIVTVRVNGCEDSDDALVTVNPVPSVTTNAPEVCVGSTLTISSNPSGGTPGYTYVWSGPSGFSASTQNVNRNNATVNMGGTYSVTVTDTKGCTAVSSKQATVNPGLTVTTSAPEVCLGTTLTISSTPSGGTPAYTYIWSGPNGFSGSTQNIIRNNSALNMSGTYSVTVTDTKGCTGVSSVLVTVNPGLNVVTSAPEVCVGSALNISSTPSGGTAGYSYMWSGPNGFSASTQNISRNNASVNMSGIYSVTVTDTKGCTGTSSTTAVVNPNPTLQASSNSPVCQGEQINLFSTPSGGTPSYTYVWSGPNSFNSAVQNPVRLNADNTMTGSYNVTVTDSKGCKAVASTSVSLTSKPVSGIEGPQTTCAKEAVLFTVNPPAGAGSVYTWTFQGGTPSTATGPSATSQWNSPGTYNIEMVVTKDGCTSSYTKTIVITEEVFSIAGPDKDICQGGNTIINGQGPSGGNFSWTVVSGDPTSIDGGGSSPNLNVSPLFTTVYRLTVSQNGCVRTDEVTVFVNVSLNPIANAGNPLNICSGVTTTIGGNPTGTPPAGNPNTPLGYIWSPGAGLSSTTVANPGLTLVTPGTYTYQVIVVALATGCSDTAVVTHTIDPKPTIQVSTTEICAGSTLTVSSTPSGGTPGYTYVWSGPNGYSASTQNVSRANATPAMSGLYSVTVTDSKGCVANSSVQATVNPNPTVQTTTTEICAGSTLTVNSTPSGGTPGYTYVWSGPNGYSASTQNISRVNATPAMSGLYSVTVTDTKGCVANSSVQAIVNPNPTIQTTTVEICAGSTLAVNSTPSGGTPGYTYVWSGPSGYSASTQNVSRTNATPAMSGLYSVTVTDSKGCVANSSVQATVNPNPTVQTTTTEICAGSTLVVNSVPSGGTPGYTYVWSGPNSYSASTQNLSIANATPAMSGLYSVTVTDTKGCIANSSVQAIVNPNPTAQSSSNSPVCVGNQINLFATPSSGTPGFTYSWTGPNNYTSSLQNPVILNAGLSMAGVYNVTVTDSKGCVANSNTSVTITSNPVSGIDGPPTTCAKEPVLFIATPAGPGSIYNWTFQGGTPPTATGPSATSQWDTPGEYLITLVVTKDGCTSSYTKSIIITQEVFSIAGPDKEICQGGNITLNGQGPAGANFSWTVVSGDATSRDNGINSMNLLVSPLFTTVYRLTVSQNGCVRTDEVTVFVNVNLNPIANAGNPLDICSGVVTTIGGNPTGTPPPGAPNTPLGYIWSPATGLNSITVSNPTLTLNNTGSYTYQVIVIALATGCSDTATVTHTVVPKPSILVATTEICAGSTLEVNSTPSGGTPGYTYVWSGPNGYSASTQNVSRANATPAMSGLYSVTVTDSKGCVANSSVQATVNPNPTIQTTTTEICAGSTLTVNSTPSGGTPGYTYVWSGPSGFSATTQNVSRANATPAMSGLYSVTVTDSKGCVANSSVQATVNPNPTVQTTTTEICAGSTLTVSSTPGGGTPGYTYVWSGPSGFSATTQNVSRANATPAMSGLYSVTVTDSKGCVANSSVQATVNPNPNVQTTTTEICAGSTLEVNSTPSGGTPGYTYVWSGPNGYSATTQNVSRANATPAMSGLYSVTVTDSKGCVANSSVQATVNPNPTVQTATTEICAGSTLEVNSTPSGGTPGYTYVWSGPSGYSATTQNVSRANATPAMSGLYSVTVTDSKGCVANSSVQATVNPNPTVQTATTEICAGSTLEVNSTPSGGTPGYTYVWSGPSGFSATTQNVSRANATPAMSGLYSVTVTDSKGCVANSSVQATVNPNPTVQAVTTEICAGSTLEVNSTPSGGTPGYTYVWSGPNGYSATTQNVSRANATPAMSGLYSVTVTDSKGCVANSSVQATVNPNPTVQAATTEICAGSTLTVNSTPSGGTPVYTYVWSGPSGFSATTQNVSRANATPAMSGLYSVTVTDSKGCVANSSVQATVNPNPTVQTTTTEICAGSTLTVNSTPSGGTPGYTYVWSGPSGFSASTQNVSRANATPAMSGLYSVTVTDSKGCVANSSVQAIVNPGSTVQVVTSEVCTGSTLEINATPNGGTPSYTYVWSGPNGFSATTQNIVRANATPAMSGLYSVTVTDSKGCVSNSSVQATVNPNPTIQATSNEVCVGSTLLITSTPNGGTPGYTYVWSGPNGFSATTQNVTRPNVTITMAGGYVVTVTDSKGCSATSAVSTTVNPNPAVVLSAPSVCAGSTLEINSTPSGGTPGYTYVWSGPNGFSATTQNVSRPDATVAMSGLYSVTVTDSKGCSSTNNSITATVEPKAFVGDFVWEDINGNGRQDLNEPGINGVTVNLFNASNNALVASTLTASRSGNAGFYQFEVCKGSYYIVFGDVPDYNRTPKGAPGTNDGNDSNPNVTTGRTDNFNLNPGDNNNTIDAGYFKPARLGDYVWEDSDVDGVQDDNETGISGVTVRLLDENGNQIRFTVTNLSGFYLFDNLAPGNYIVKFDTKAGYIPTANERGGNDEKDSDADPVTGRAPLVTLVSGQSDLTIDAGFYRLARIGDFVWEDTNLNNVQDAFEPALQNVTVTLNGVRGTDGSIVNLSTTTDNMGRYDFNNLTPGSYTVTFTRPGSQYLSVVPNFGSDDAIDSDADAVTGQTQTYQLKSGEYNNTIDAGYYRCAKVGDFVWLDFGSNANVQDGGDLGINNVQVQLFQAFTNTLIETQFTRNSPIDGRPGYYLFDCVRPGTYYIKVTRPTPGAGVSRYEFVVPNQGGDDMLDSDVVDFINGTTLNFTVGYAQTILDIDIGFISILPVDVKELSGWWNKDKDVNQLRWVTTKEINNSHFIIERSLDSGEFVEYAKINGKGFSNNEVVYEYNDWDISLDGIYDYRVKQVDFDGKNTEIGTVSIKVYRDELIGVQVYPNPTKDNVQLKIEAVAGQNVSYDLYDGTGRLILSKNLGEMLHSGSDTYSVEMYNLIQGVYYLRLNIGNETFVRKLIKIE
jgi:trimeric autotransporter adhesin